MERHDSGFRAEPPGFSGRNENQSSRVRLLFTLSRHEPPFPFQDQQQHVHARAVYRDVLPRLQAGQQRLHMNAFADHHGIEFLRAKGNRIPVRVENGSHESSVGPNGFHSYDPCHSDFRRQKDGLNLDKIEETELPIPLEMTRPMGLYAKHVLPRLIDQAMRKKDATRLRAAWIPQAQGDVLEIGIGSGLNLPFYSTEVRRVYGVEPSNELQRMARERAAGTGFAVEFLPQSAENPLPLPDGSIDTVVSTWTLCSIPNAIDALRQARRVLKTQGRLIFIEHGRAQDPGVVIWQDRLTPFWKRIGGGCHLNRKIDELIRVAGFQISEVATDYLPGPRPLTYIYQGFATRV